MRQVGVALAGRPVTLWELSPEQTAVPLWTSGPNSDDVPTPGPADIEAALRQWGQALVPGSQWLGVQLGNGQGWCVAPVRNHLPAPPPGGVERRSPERVTLELAALSLGLMEVGDPHHRRLPPAEALWELSRQPSVLAHELGNALAVALGNLELSVNALQAATLIQADLRTQLLEDLWNVASGIQHAVQHLRSIQQRPAGGADRLERFDALPVIEACVALERPVAQKQGITIRLESGEQPAFLLGDPSALYQVASNLLRNAVQALEGRTGSIGVTLREEGGTLRLVVADDGPGIAPEELSRIFESGFTTKPTGSGMGLTVVQEVTQKIFGGTVNVASTVGKGATFRVDIPVPVQRWEGGEADTEQ